MKAFLLFLVEEIARFHTSILSLNDSYEYNFSDKELHFIVIGVIGMAVLLLVHPLFTLLARTDHIIVISFIYVFTLILVLVFAIEIGQGYSGSGTMDFADITSGVNGFLLFFFIFAIIRAIIRGIIKLFRGADDD